MTPVRQQAVAPALVLMLVPTLARIMVLMLARTLALMQWLRRIWMIRLPRKFVATAMRLQGAPTQALLRMRQMPLRALLQKLWPAARCTQLEQRLQDLQTLISMQCSRMASSLLLLPAPGLQVTMVQSMCTKQLQPMCLPQARMRRQRHLTKQSMRSRQAVPMLRLAPIRRVQVQAMRSLAKLPKMQTAHQSSLTRAQEMMQRRTQQKSACGMAEAVAQQMCTMALLRCARLTMQCSRMHRRAWTGWMAQTSSCRAQWLTRAGGRSARLRPRSTAMVQRRLTLQ